MITGLGQISSMGNSIDELIQNFSSDFSNFNLAENGNTPCIAAKVNGFDFYQCGFKIKTYTDRASQLCIYAASQAAISVAEGSIEQHRRGLITSSCFGCSDSASKYLHQLKTLKKARFARPLFFIHSICNMPNSITAIECGLKAASNHLVGSSDSGLMALWQGIQNLNTNSTDYVIAGGFDALSDELLQKLNMFRLVSTDTNINGIRGPFDRNRKYAVFGEAAAFLGIEKRDPAIKMGRKIYGEIRGIGIATSHKDKAESITRAMKLALEKSRLGPQAISFILSNANGTITNDRREARAIKETVGSQLPVFAPKSYFGETFAAAGLLGIVSVLSLVNKKLPVNRYLYNVEDGLDINVQYCDTIVKNGDVFLVNGCNRGGTSVSVCIEVCGGDR